MSRPLRDDDLTLNLRKERRSSVYFVTDFVEIQAKTYTSLESTLSLAIYDKTSAKKR